jgi:hypothetical protein
MTGDTRKATLTCQKPDSEIPALLLEIQLNNAGVLKVTMVLEFERNVEYSIEDPVISGDRFTFKTSAKENGVNVRTTGNVEPRCGNTCPVHSFENAALSFATTSVCEAPRTMTGLPRGNRSGDSGFSPDFRTFASGTRGQNGSSSPKPTATALPANFFMSAHTARVAFSLSVTQEATELFEQDVRSIL